MRKMSITVLLFLLSFSFSYAGDLTPGQVTGEFIRLIEEKNAEALKALEDSGYTLKKSHPKKRGHVAGLGGFGTQGFNRNDYTRITEITDLSKTLVNLGKWKDVAEALKENDFDIVPQKNEDSIRNFASEKCREAYSKLRQRLEFYQCHFRVGATFAKLEDDKTNCSRDTKVLYSIEGKDKQEQMEYLCLRNLGWKDPTDWKNNVNYSE